MDFHNTSLRDYEAQQAADHRYLLSLDEETCWQDAGFCDFWDACATGQAHAARKMPWDGLGELDPESVHR